MCMKYICIFLSHFSVYVTAISLQYTFFLPFINFLLIISTYSLVKPIKDKSVKKPQVIPEISRETRVLPPEHAIDPHHPHRLLLRRRRALDVQQAQKLRHCAGQHHVL